MPGGTRSYEMARRLVAAGHVVEMITTDQSGGKSGWRESDEAGIRVHWANVRYGNEMPFFRRVLAFLAFAVKGTFRAARLEGDVILATSTPLTIAIPALLTSRWKRIPFVFEVRDMWPDVPIAIGALRNPVSVWLAKKLELLAYRRANRIVALAPGMRDDIIAKGIAPEKVSVIPNGCDRNVFGAPPPGHSPRDEYPWLGNRRLVLFAGTLGTVNGVDYLVRLAARVGEHDPEVRFVVIGGGRDRERVRELAAEAGVLDRNFFMFPPMAKQELVPWLAAADFVVALFTGPPAVWKDAVQNKFFDALAAGKPVANNFDGWQSRIAVEYDVGMILDPHDLDHARDSLLRYLRDDEWLAGVPARARALAEGPFDRDHLAARMEAVLLEAAGVRADADFRNRSEPSR